MIHANFVELSLLDVYDTAVVGEGRERENLVVK